MESIIEIKELRRAFGDIRAVDGLTFEVQPGEVFGLLGPNGAGKTTTVRLLNGILPPRAARCVSLGWIPPHRASRCARRPAC